MKFGIILLTYLISFGAFSSARAANYDGVISNLNSKRAITLKISGKRYFIVPVNTEIAIQIGKLKVNDFVSLEGRLDQLQLSLFVTSMNYVGLKDLLGNWVGDDEYCYSFSSFSSLSIFNKTKNLTCDFSEARLSRDFSYTINPATSSWLVLLSDNDESYIMDLILRSKSSAELSLYDTRSGDILREIKLKR